MFCYQFCVTIHDWWHVQVLWRDRSCCDSIVKLVLMHNKFFVVLRMHEHLVNRFKHEPLATTPQCFQNAQHVYGVYYAWIDQWAGAFAINTLSHMHIHILSHTHTLFPKSIWYEIYTGIRKPKIQLKFSNQCDFIRWLHHIYMILEYNLNFIIWTISVVLFFFPSFDFFSSAAAADVTVAAIGIAGDSYVRAFFFFWNRFIYLNGIRFEQIKRKNCQFHMYPV